MVTTLGRELRKLRIDRDERMLDMAKKLKVSSSFISAIEVGKKAPPSKFEERVISLYKVPENVAETIRSAADQSRTTFTLNPKGNLARDTAGLLARKMDTLTEKEIRDIRKVLGRE